MQRVQVRRSTTPGDRPSSLLEGEVAFNIADKLMYIGGHDGSVVSVFEGTTFSLPHLLDGSISGTSFTLKQLMDGTASGSTYNFGQLLNGTAEGTAFSLTGLLNDTLNKPNSLTSVMNGRFGGPPSILLDSLTGTGGAVVAINPAGGGSGVVAGMRTATSPGNSYALGAFALNDATTPQQTGWALYGEARKMPGAGLTIGATITTVAQTLAVRAHPDSMLASDMALGLVLQAGRPSVTPNLNPSAALGILGENAPWAKWQAGLVFGANSVDQATDLGLPLAIAVDLPTRYGFVWRDPLTFTPSAWVHSEVSQPSTANGSTGGFMYFHDTGLLLASRATNGVELVLDRNFVTIVGSLNVTQGTTTTTLLAQQAANFAGTVTIADTLTSDGNFVVNGEGFFNNSLAINGIAFFNDTVGMVGQIILSTHIPVFANDGQAAAAGHPMSAVYRNSSFGNCLKMREV